MVVIGSQQIKVTVLGSAVDSVGEVEGAVSDVRR